MALRTVQRLDEVEAADEWAAKILAASEEGADELGRALDAFVDRAAAADARSSSRDSCTSSGSPRRVPAAGVAGAVDRRRSAQRRGCRRALEPAAGAHAHHDGEQHHQPARHRPSRLAHVRRAAERDGGGAARGSLGSLRADDVRDPRRVPPRRGAHRPSARDCGRTRPPPRRSSWHATPGTAAPTIRAEATSATTSWTRGSRSWRRRPGTGRPPGSVCIAWCCVIPTSSSSAASSSAR